jgi:hypothetical protein
MARDDKAKKRAEFLKNKLDKYQSELKVTQANKVKV